MKDSNIDKIDVEDYIYGINDDENIVFDWLETMYDKNPLLPNNIIDELKNNAKNINKLIETNINIMAKTARISNKDLVNNFMSKHINIKQILLNICKILFQYKKNTKMIISICLLINLLNISKILLRTFIN